MPSHREIEELAYQKWEARGRPEGSPEMDWFEAEQHLQAAAPDDPLTRLARGVGSAIGNAVAFVTDLDPRS